MICHSFNKLLHSNPHSKMAVQSNPTKRFHLKFMFWLLPLLILQAGNVICNNEQDEITDPLPGLTFKLNFKHYSGFLQVSKTRFLHYWFVTSQNNPETDPLVFWFNGGPGCSSMDGLLKEMGPYLVNADGQTLDKNPHAWNRNASIVYIESPAGVGFSYSSDGNFTTDDDQTAEDNYEAVKQFFGKFPSFRQQPLFIAGESYAGIYVPMLTAKLVSGQSKFPVNLKGMVIGNGYVDVNLNVDTSIRFAYAHGLVDEHLWKRKIVGECCSGNVGKCDLAALEGSCGETIEDIFDYLWDGGLNIYDLYRDCDSGTSLKFETMKQGLIPAKIRKTPASADFGKAPPKGLNCLDDSDVTTYMNLKEVRKALHIPKSLPEWTICSRNVSRNYHRTYANVYGFVKKILRAHVRVLLYYGDTDMACNFLLGQQFSSRVGPRLVAKKEAWTFNGQISGFKTAYANGLTYLTVRGAGHMVPQWRPTQMEYVFNQFLTNQTIGE